MSEIRVRRPDRVTSDILIAKSGTSSAFEFARVDKSRSIERLIKLASLSKKVSGFRGAKRDDQALHSARSLPDGGGSFGEAPELNGRSFFRTIATELNAQLFPSTMLSDDQTDILKYRNR